MTDQEKELVYRELCSRIPYGVKFLWDDHGLEGGSKVVKLYKVKVYGETIDDYVFSGLGQPEPGYEYDCRIDDIKPYLRPMSSRTNEEVEEYAGYIRSMMNEMNGHHLFNVSKKLMKFCLSHYLDINNLIEKGLALEAPDGMY